MDSSLRSCPASMVSMTLGAEPLATPAPSKIDLKAASGFSLTDQYSAAGLTNFLFDISLDTSSGMFNCFTSFTNCFGSSIAHTEKRVKQQVLLANCHKAGRYTPRTNLGSLSERAARHRAQSTPRRLQAQPCAKHNAHLRLPAQHCGHSPAKRRLRAQPPAQGAANSTAPGPREPTDTREWLPAQLLGHTPQTCPRTHTGAATSSAPGSWPPSTRAHAQKPHKPHLGTRHKCNLSHTATHCKQHAALPETHDMWYKHHAQKVPRRKNPRIKCASVKSTINSKHTRTRPSRPHEETGKTWFPHTIPTSFAQAVWPHGRKVPSCSHGSCSRNTQRRGSSSLNGAQARLGSPPMDTTPWKQRLIRFSKKPLVTTASW